MTSTKQNVKIALLFGGQSPEHDVSIQSARNILKAIKIAGYETVLVGIDTLGVWRLMQSIESPSLHCPAIALLPGGRGRLIDVSTGKSVDSVDTVFPAVHGPNCEDGSLQGSLRLANVPFVGSSICSSASCMDKAVCKSLLTDAGIETVEYIACTRETAPTLDVVKSSLGMPLIVKPANMGSSIGVQKVEQDDQFEAAVQLAFSYDRKILIEKYINALEIECAVLNRCGAKVSVPGSISPSQKHEFYSYQLKYVDAQGATIEIPAKISPELTARAQDISISAFRVLGCEGMARVDLFLDRGGKLLVNEINTLPGFTSSSLYPKLWEASGVSQAEIIHDLVTHSLARFEAEKGSLH